MVLPRVDQSSCLSHPEQNSLPQESQRPATQVILDLSNWTIEINYRGHQTAQIIGFFTSK